MSTDIECKDKYHLTRFAAGEGKCGLQLTLQNSRRYIQLDVNEAKELGEFLLKFAKDPMAYEEYQEVDPLFDDMEELKSRMGELEGRVNDLEKANF